MKTRALLILDRAIRLPVQAPKVGHLHSASVCEWEINFQGCYGVTASSSSVTFCLLFQNWDTCPKVGHSLVPYVLIVTRLFCHPFIRKK